MYPLTSGAAPARSAYTQAGGTCAFAVPKPLLQQELMFTLPAGMQEIFLAHEGSVDVSGGKRLSKRAAKRAGIGRGVGQRIRDFSGEPAHVAGRRLPPRTDLSIGFLSQTEQDCPRLQCGCWRPFADVLGVGIAGCSAPRRTPSAAPEAIGPWRQRAE